jgi:hypothetical protein
MLKELTKIANRLDEIGLTKEADVLDNFINKIAGSGGEMPEYMEGGFGEPQIGDTEPYMQARTYPTSYTDKRKETFDKNLDTAANSFCNYIKDIAQLIKDDSNEINEETFKRLDTYHARFKNMITKGMANRQGRFEKSHELIGDRDVGMMADVDYLRGAKVEHYDD